MGVQDRGIPRVSAHEVLMADDFWAGCRPTRQAICHSTNAGLLRVWNNSVSDSRLMDGR
jgi:hypothetical protein